MASQHARTAEAVPVGVGGMNLTFLRARCAGFTSLPICSATLRHPPLEAFNVKWESIISANMARPTNPERKTEDRDTTLGSAPEPEASQ